LIARKIMIFFWAGTVVFLAVNFVLALFTNDGEQGAAAAWIPMVGMLLFGICAVASTVAWFILAAREITRSPTSNPAVEAGRPENPGADHRER